MAEAYNDVLTVASDDPTVVALGQSSSSIGFPGAGFDAIYGHDAYSVIRGIYMGPKWANDIELLHLALSDEPAFPDGHFFPSNPCNLKTKFGRCDGETVSGRWLYVFLRYDPNTEQRFLIVANFHTRYALIDVWIEIPEDAHGFLALPPGCSMYLVEKLSGLPIEAEAMQYSEDIAIGSVSALTAYYFFLTVPGLS